MIKVMVLCGALLSLTGCSQYQMYKCVRDIVNGNEPYRSQAELDDSEALARQTCRERAAGRSDG